MKTLKVLHFLALPTNIRLGLKGLPGMNTLAYYGNLLITAVKSFVVHAPSNLLKLVELELC